MKVERMGLQHPSVVFMAFPDMSRATLRAKMAVITVQVLWQNEYFHAVYV